MISSTRSEQSQNELAQRVLTRFKARDRDGAASDLRALLDDNAPLGTSWRNLAKLGEILGETDATADAAVRAYEATKHDMNAAVEAAATLTRLSRHNEALRILQDLPDKSRAAPPIEHLTGTIKAELGQFAKARGHLERTLHSWPHSGPVWLTLVGIERFSADHPARRQLESVVQNAPTDDENKAALHYALGKMQDDAGEFELAFRSYTLGAALARTKRLYDPQKDAANANSLTLTYTHDAFSTLAKSEATVEPIFIIAPPRSGTTLLSQLLTQHRNVSTVGESNLAQAAMMPIRGFSLGHVSAFDGAHGANGWTRLGDTIARLLAERAQSDGSARIVDKTLNTLRLLGPLSIAVPRAKFIRLTRDPRDVATSCFRTYFTEGLGWTFSLEHIANHLKAEQALSDHWATVLGGRMYTLSYEDLVSNTEEQLQSLGNFLEIEMTPNMMSPHLTNRGISTASVREAREAVNTNSIGRWKRYEKALHPFTEAYGTSGLN